jgi:hypothetical protein
MPNKNKLPAMEGIMRFTNQITDVVTTDSKHIGGEQSE